MENLTLVQGRSNLFTEAYTVRVLSKWNDFMGEDDHLTKDVIYFKSPQWNGEVEVEFYTDREL